MTVDVAVIGCGWWATQAHLPALAADPGARIVAIVDPDPAKRDRAGQRFGVVARYAEVGAMLDAERLDAAIVATPHATHAEVARACLDRGLHLLVEKPLTLTPDDAFDLVARARAAGRQLIAGYPYHYVPQLQELRRRLALGVVGRLEVVVGLFASIVRELYRGQPEVYRDVLGYRLNAPGPDTYSDPAIAGGGQGQTQVTHLAALALWLTGLEPVTVTGRTASFELAVDLADAFAVGFRGGALGSFASTGSVSPTQPEILELRLFGSTGHVVVDAAAGTTVVHAGDGSVDRLPETHGADRYPEWAPARNLVRVVRGEEPNESPGELAATVVALIDALYRSARSGMLERIATPSVQRPVVALEGVSP